MADHVTKAKDGIPQWTGDSHTFQEYEELAPQWEQSMPYQKRYLCGPKLLGELSGTARKFVVGKRPDWVSYDGGVKYLMSYLRKSLGRPQIPELSDYLTRYFRQSKRHRFESMNDYIVRKTELYSRARQALTRVQYYHMDTKKVNLGGSQRQSYWDDWWGYDFSRGWTSAQWGNQTWEDRRSAAGSQQQSTSHREDQEGWETASEAAEAEGRDDPERVQRWGYQSNHGSHRSSSQWHSYDEDETWTTAAEGELLPDFLQGWYLLADSGLDSQEKNMIQTAVNGNFGQERIAQELRAQWPEEDLTRRDQQQKQSSFWNDDIEEDDNPGNSLNTTRAALMSEGMNSEGLALILDASEQEEEAPRSQSEATPGQDE